MCPYGWHYRGVHLTLVCSGSVCIVFSWSIAGWMGTVAIWTTLSLVRYSYIIDFSDPVFSVSILWRVFFECLQLLFETFSLSWMYSKNSKTVLLHESNEAPDMNLVWCEYSRCMDSTFHSRRAVYRVLYTGCFTTLGHNCRRWFRRSLWWKKFI